MKYKVGDVVVLRSGGPRMTVIEVRQALDSNPDLIVACWITQEHVVQTTTFPSVCLFKVRQPTLPIPRKG